MKVTDKTAGNAETSRVEYTYDAFDYMVGRKVFLSGSGTASESQHFVYDGDEIVLTLQDNGAVANRYLRGPAVDELLAQENSASTTYWALTDNLGTPRDWVNNSGTVASNRRVKTWTVLAENSIKSWMTSNGGIRPISLLFDYPKWMSRPTAPNRSMIWGVSWRLFDVGK